MATTVTLSNGVVEITGLDADWSWQTTFPNKPGGIEVFSITFSGNAADKLSLREGADDGARLFPIAILTAEKLEIIMYYGDRPIRPYINFSESTVAGTESVVIKLR